MFFLGWQGLYTFVRYVFCMFNDLLLCKKIKLGLNGPFKQKLFAPL